MLWVLSSTMVVSIAGTRLCRAGLHGLVRAASIPGSRRWLSWRVGRPLIDLNAERYAREAEFRFALVRVNEEIEGVTLNGGEADERDRLDWIFAAVVASLRTDRPRDDRV